MAAKIKPVPTYKAGKAPTGYAPGGIATKPAPKIVVPKTTAQKIVNPAAPKPALGMAGLGIQPGYVGQAKMASTAVPAWGPAKAPGDATGVPRSTAPSNYLASLADIQGNPLYQQALGHYNTSMQDFMDALKGNIGQAVIKAGYDPTEAFNALIAQRPDLAQFSGLLSGVDRAAAAANPTSERAMNQQNYDRGLENQSYELAARGMGQSGAAATGTNSLLQNRQMQENQTRDALLQAIQGGMTGYLGQQTEGYDKLQGVGAQVAELLAQQQGAVYGSDEEGYDAAQGTAGDMTPADEVAANPNTVPGTAIPSAANTNYITWGGPNNRIYNVGQMQQWLKAHGQNWNTWAANHLDAAKKLLALS